MTDDTRDPAAPPDPAEMDESEAPIEDANDETVEDGDVPELKPEPEPPLVGRP